MLRIALETVRDRWLSFAGSLVALTLGVVLTGVAGLVLTAALTGDGPQRGQRYAAADLLVVPGQDPEAVAARTGPDDRTELSVAPGPTTLPASVVGRVAAVPGVARAVADRVGYAQLARDGVPVGLPGAAPVARAWQMASFGGYRLSAGRAPMSVDEVVVDARLAAAAYVTAGTRVSLLTPAGTRDAVVTGIADQGDAEPAEATVFVTDRALRSLTPQPDRAAAVAVTLAQGASPADVTAGVRAALAGVSAYPVTGADKTDAEPVPGEGDLAVVSILLGITAVLAVFVTVFVVASTFAFTVAARQQEIALLRAVGATVRQVRRTVTLEALTVGVLAGVAGSAAAVPAARWFGTWLAAEGMAPERFTVAVRWLPLAGAAGIGVVVALLGALSAARRAGRVAPVEAMRDAAGQDRVMTLGRWICGLLVVAAAAGVAVASTGVRPQDAVSLAMLLSQLTIVAVAIFAPLVVPGAARLLTAPFGKLRGATVLLARQNALTAVRRTAATAAPVLVTLGLAGALMSTTATLDAAATRSTDHLRATWTISPAGMPGLPQATLTAADRVDGVSVVPAIQDTAYVDGTNRAALAVPVDRAADVLAVTPSSGTLRNLPDDAVALSAATAADAKLTVGRVAPITLSDGTVVKLRVAAVYPNGFDTPDLFLPYPVAARHTPMATTAFVLGRDDPATAAALRAAVQPTATVLSIRDSVAAAAATSAQSNRIVLTVLLGMALVYTSIAVANTLVMAIGQRTRELSLLRLGGATTRQVVRVIAVEAILVAVTGTVLAAVSTAATLAVLMSALRRFAGDITLVVPWATLGALTAAMLGICLVASVAPTVLSLRRSPALLAGLRA